MRGSRAALPMALALGIAGFAAVPAHALVSTLYVQNGVGSHCSDSGPGSSATPYCTISKAASAVQAGQTVMVGYGVFPETVTITAKGTAAAPIRFVGQSSPQNPTATWIGDNGPSTGLNHLFVLNGAQYVTLTGFALSGGQQGAVLVQDSQHVTVDQSQVVNPGGLTRDVLVTGSSSAVTVSRDFLYYGVGLGSGVSGTVITTNVVSSGLPDNTGGLLPQLAATDAPGTVITGNTLTASCGPAVDLEGASTGATIENNIVDAGVVQSCDTSPPATGITVASGATTGTTTDYNVVYMSGDAPYSWNGITYSTLSAFTTATGQGTHDLGTDPKLVVPQAIGGPFDSVPFYPSEGTPEVDSANAAAPGEPTADIYGLSRVDDPLVVNAGTGSGFVDRGAFEYQDPISLVAATVKHAAGGGPLDVNITTGVTAAWSNQITYTYSFGDGTPDVVTTSSTVRHDFASAGAEYMMISANDGFASNPSGDQNSFPSVVLGADYTPMTPARLLDTRNATGIATTTPVAPNSDITLTVGGIDGIPTAGLSAVVLNVTATQGTAHGYLTVYPHGMFLPTASNLNYAPNQNVPNLVTVPVRDGKVNFHNGSSGTVHVIADAEGYYADSGYGFKAVSPLRVLDTRVPIGVAAKAPAPANGQIQLDLSSKVPAGTQAVTLNVTVTDTKGNGVITAFPDGVAVPNASNLNFMAGQTVPNLVTVALHNGKVDFHNTSSGTADLVADLAGYYGDSTTGATTGFMPMGPERVIDTRVNGTGPIAANGTLHVGSGWFPSFNSLPAAGTGAIVNVTVTNPKSNGYLTVYPDGASRPNASNLNFSTNQTVPNLVSTVFGTDGIDIYNGGTGTTDVVVDLEGYFVPPLS